MRCISLFARVYVFIFVKNVDPNGSSHRAISTFAMCEFSEHTQAFKCPPNVYKVLELVDVCQASAVSVN